MVAFAFLTPLFFVRGGMAVSRRRSGPASAPSGILVAAQDAAEDRAASTRSPGATRRRTRWFGTLLMSTGLTFGTITSLYGLNAGIIDRTQFSLLIAVVVLSAIVPTAIAQRFYSPTIEEQRDLTAPVAPAGLWGAEAEAEV